MPFKNTRQSIVILLIALVISSGSLVFASTASQSISSFGMIQHPTNGKTWVKTVTWADGKTETIQISDKGRIYLNGKEVKAFGFVIATNDRKLYPDEADKIFSWCQEKGVRFMTLYIVSHWKDRINEMLRYYLPLFYKYKFFVVLNIHPHWWNTPYEAWKDIEKHLEGTKYAIDLVDSLGYSDLVFTWGATLEMDIDADSFGLGTDEIESWLTTVTSRTKEMLSTSKIGNIPVIHSCNGSMRAARVLLMKYSDIPCEDSYPPDIASWEYRKPAGREIREEGGKGGYQRWQTEFGSDPDRGIPEDLFVHVLGEPDISAMFIWEIGTCRRWKSFVDGEPSPWLEECAPYFPVSA